MGHCCERMTEKVQSTCEQHPDRFDCPDCVIDYDPKFDEYGIIVHDGGRSYVTIDFCPFCGTKLPESKRDLWFERLKAMGVEDPWSDDIPEKSRTDEWLRT